MKEAIEAMEQEIKYLDAQAVAILDKSLRDYLVCRDKINSIKERLGKIKSNEQARSKVE